MLNWEFRKDQNAWFGNSTYTSNWLLNSKWLFRIINKTDCGQKPYQLFCAEMEKIDNEYYSAYDLEDINKFYLTRVSLEIFSLKSGWTEIESSREILIRDVKIGYQGPYKKQICVFDTKSGTADYRDDLDEILKINKLKLQEHAEFLMNSGWNPFI